MALKVNVILPSGAQGTYLCLDEITFSRRTRTAYAQLSLYANSQRREEFPDYPVAVVGVLNIAGDKFDHYFSKEALANVGGDILAQFYQAVKLENIRATQQGLEIKQEVIALAEKV